MALLTLDELQRLTPEQLKALAPDQYAAALELLSPSLRLSSEEQRQREAAWQLADEPAWRTIAQSCVTLIIESYRRGDMDLGETLAAIQRASIGCWVQNRLHLLGLTAALALRTNPIPKKRGYRSPRWPLWVQTATAALVLEGRNGARRFAEPRCQQLLRMRSAKPARARLL